MGVTIHFNLEAPPETDKARAKEIVTQLRRRAQRYRSGGRVDAVLPLGEDDEALRWGRTCRFIRLPGRSELSDVVDLEPIEGFVLPVMVGKDCEPLWLGLCRYP